MRHFSSSERLFRGKNPNGKNDMKKLFCLVSIATVLSTAVFADFEEVSKTPAKSVTSTPTKAADARLQLVTMAETGATTATAAQVRALVESYRIDQKPGFMPLRLAPYPRFLINAKLGEIYPALYKQQLDAFLNLIPLELLFDGVLDMVATGNIDPSLKDSLKGLDRHMARRAIKGKGPDCKLDESEKIEHVSTANLLLLKVDKLNTIPACTYRKRLFNSAKQALITARKDPKTIATVREKALTVDEKTGEGPFQTEFRKGFLAQIDTTINTFGDLVQKKFGAATETHPIWTDMGSVIEGDAAISLKDGHRTIQMKSFSQGLLAVVNRWLLLTGGNEADWDDTKREMPVADLGLGVKPPKFKEVEFGGWGAQSAGLGVEMSAWDWGGYQPSAPKHPSPLRIFPTQFEVDTNGAATLGKTGIAYQTNDDLAYLLLAVSEFLKDTQPGTPLSKFFGGADKIADLLDETKPMLFPTEGRLIAVGVLSAVAQNLLDPTIGHIASKRDGIPVYFRDHGSFGSLQETDIDTRGVCSVLVAASKLTKVLKTDPVMKKEKALAGIVPQINELVQISSLVVGREQGFDGSIPAKMASADKTPSIGSQIGAIRVFLAAFNASPDPTNATFVMARLAPALTYLFSNQVNVPKNLDLEARLNVIAVWNQSQTALRKIRTDLPWATWDAEMKKISSR
jgi:hypothetical protein